MPTDLFSSAQPREDVLTGALTDASLAANLDEVVAGSAPDVYGDASLFFEQTYPSHGLREVLNEVFGRLSGAKPDNAPIIRMETALGGGKTHNLIALLHVAGGELSSGKAMEFMDSRLLPDGHVNRAVFVGTSSGATSFPAVDGVQPQTVWGYIAAQLGGPDGYEKVRSDDENLTAPGAAALAEVLGDGPVLVLIDELARYLATADGRTVGHSTLAKQTTAFLMALIEAVAGKPRAALVLTSTRVTDAFGDQTQSVLAAVGEAMSLVARKEHTIRPAAEADLPRILARRLFEQIDTGAAADVAAAYVEALGAAADKGIEIPERLSNPSFAKEIEGSYPFHPDLVMLLDKRLSTNPNFNLVRGALRLLARSVRDLWEDKPTGTLLIHPHHISLRNPNNVEDLTSKIDRATFEPVIRSDIASQPGASPSRAEQVDAILGLPLAQRLATTAYLYSLTRDVPGAPAGVLLANVVDPVVDPNQLVKALDDFERVAWYLHTAEAGYRFSTEITLTRVIQEKEQEVVNTQVNAKATDLLEDAFKPAAFKVRHAWKDSKVPDHSDDAWLVVVHWEAFGDARGITDLADPVPANIQSIWEKAPAGGLREFRNRLVFLAPSADTHPLMLKTVRRLLALERALNDNSTMSQLSHDKRLELADLRKEATLAARVAVCNHLNVLYVPQGGQGAPRLEPEQLPVVTQASLRPNQTVAVEERLAADGKTLAAGDKVFDPGLFKSKVGKQLEGAMPTERVVELFAQRADLKLVLDVGQVRRMIQAGVQNGVWEYQDTTLGDEGWATAERAAAAYRIAPDTYLHAVGTAPEPDDTSTDDDDDDELPDDDQDTPSTFIGSGQGGYAIAQARDAATAAGRKSVQRITVEVSETGTAAKDQLARVQAVIPSSLNGAVAVTYRVDLKLDLGGTGESLSLNFVGTAKDWQPFKSVVDSTLKGREAVLKAVLAGAFATPLALTGQELEDIRQQASDIGPSSCKVTLTTEDQDA